MCNQAAFLLLPSALLDKITEKSIINRYLYMILSNACESIGTSVANPNFNISP